MSTDPHHFWLVNRPTLAVWGLCVVTLQLTGRMCKLCACLLDDALLRRSSPGAAAEKPINSIEPRCCRSAKLEKKKPLALPCGHTFCEPCLSRQAPWSGTLRCVPTVCSSLLSAHHLLHHGSCLPAPVMLARAFSNVRSADVHSASSLVAASARAAQQPKVPMDFKDSLLTAAAGGCTQPVCSAQQAVPFSTLPHAIAVAHLGGQEGTAILTSAAGHAVLDA